MRIIILLVKYSLFLIIGAGVIGLIAREAFLFWGTQQVRIAENKMEVAGGARLKTQYDAQCRAKGSSRAGMSARLIQLRFTSDTEYQSEVVCDFFSNDPIVIETYTLPPFVKKVSGQAGFVWNSKGTTGGIILEVYGRKTTLVSEEKKFKMTQGAQVVPGVQPEATCGGYGYACCSPETQVGTGDLFRQASDCSSECYPTCLPRPTVLKFTSDPNPDLKERKIILGKGVPITFYFVSDTGASNIATTQIQFGDGQTQDFAENEARYTYQYQCAQVECQYTAQILITDPNGVTSVPTSISTIKIVVR